MKSPVRKLVYHYRRKGTAGLLPKIFGFCRQRAWSETPWLVYEQRLVGALAHGSGRLLRREIGLQDLIASSHEKACAFPESISTRLETGLICHGFYLGERLATVGWSSVGCLELDEDVRISYPEAAALFDFITFEEFRSRGCYTEALMQLVAEMQRRGFARAVIAVNPGNAPSIKAIERAGFRQASVVIRRWRCGVRSIIRE